MKIDDTTQPLIYPAIKDGEVYLSQFEIRFDKLLCLDGTLYTTGCGKDWVMVFPTLDDAKKYAEARIQENPEIGFSIQNHLKEPGLTIKDEARFEEIRRKEFGVGQKKCWQFWKPKN